MERIKSWAQALDYMYARLPMFQRQGPSAYKKDLSNTLLLSEACSNPHAKLKCVHIAGTNGKGTVSHIIAGGLQSQGYSVGVYTSPHYKDFRERIKINGVFISKKYIIEFLNTYMTDIELIRPSFFEMTVVLSYCYFRDQQVDYAVIETGLGGRLDSTNIITPILSVITNISYDHQALLGDTLEQIAGEKAGIIKPSIPVIIGETQTDTENVFITKAKQFKAKIIWADKNISYHIKNRIGEYEIFDIKKEGNLLWHNLETDITGPFQHKNLITGLYALHFLSETIKFNFQKFSEFLPKLKSKTKYFGRWQILSNNPIVLTDSAHNEGGLKIVLAEVQKFSFDRLHIVIGFVNDKDVSNILALFPTDAKYYFAKANIPRGLGADELRKSAMNFGLKGKSYMSVKKALAAAKLSAKKTDMIYVGGSIFVVAEIL